MPDSRMIEITVTARYPVEKIVDDYPDACSTDGGYTGSLEDYIADHIRGFVNSMTEVETGLDYTVVTSVNPV